MPDKDSLAKALMEIGLDLRTAFGSPMLPDYVRRRIAELMKQREQEADAVNTPADWWARREHLHGKLAQSFGLHPVPDLTPLNVQDLGSIAFEDYQVQKLTFEPRPGCVVPAHVYWPQPLVARAPAILFSLGHWIENAKMEPDQQAACIGLVKLGFVVLSYDPADQGERQSDWRCHNHLEAYLVGISQAGFNVWESIRAIDYLQSLPQVDAERIGMTGASGGGHNTLYVSAIDERVKVSVPVCYVNAYEYLLGAMRGYNWVGGQDLCNQVARVFSYADMGDIAALIAPRPLRIINAVQDPMFPTQGAQQAAARAQRVYDLLNVGDHIDLTLIDDVHSYNKEMREAAYGWFSKWLKGRGDGSPIPEPLMAIPRSRYAVHYITASAEPSQPKPLADPNASPEMYCFPPDRPHSSWAALTAAVRDRAQDLPPIQNQVKTVAEWTAIKPALLKSVQEVLGPFPRRPAYTPGIVNTLTVGRFRVECIRYESELGITIPAVLYLNLDWHAFQPVLIYTDYRGKRAPLLDGTVEKLLNLGYAVFTFDLRGTGATAATEFENATDSFMLDRDLFAQRVWDVLQAFNYVAAYSVIGVQIDKHRIACIGRGIGGLLALYASAFDQRIAAVACIDAPVSYQEMIQEHAAYPASAYLFDVLNHFEIEQVASMTAPRPLCIVNPLDGKVESTGGKSAVQSYAWCHQVYRALGSSHRFKLIPDVSEGGAGLAAEWFLKSWRNSE
jgi:cephalosporin-C deacetylase-like acetyl esterase